MFPFGQRITVLTRTAAGRDTDGNATFTWVSMPVRGAFAPGGSSELVQGQDVVITQPTVYLPAGTVVGPSDRVQVAGLTFEVDGSPNEWQSPFTGRLPGVEVKLKAVSG